MRTRRGPALPAGASQALAAVDEKLDMTFRAVSREAERHALERAQDASRVRRLEDEVCALRVMLEGQALTHTSTLLRAAGSDKPSRQTSC